MSSYRNPATLLGCMNLTTIFGATIYLRSHHIHNLEEHEAWMDETEGTLRSHIGLVEGTLESLKANMPRKEEAMIAPLKEANIHVCRTNNLSCISHLLVVY